MFDLAGVTGCDPVTPAMRLIYAQELKLMLDANMRLLETARACWLASRNEQEKAAWMAHVNELLDTMLMLKALAVRG